MGLPESDDSDSRLLETQPIILPSFGDIVVSDPHGGDSLFLVTGTTEDQQDVHGLLVKEENGIMVPRGWFPGTIRVADIDRPFKGYLSRQKAAQTMARILMPNNEINPVRLKQILEENPEQ